MMDAPISQSLHASTIALIKLTYGPDHNTPYIIFHESWSVEQDNAKRIILREYLKYCAPSAENQKNAIQTLPKDDDERPYSNHHHRNHLIPKSHTNPILYIPNQNNFLRADSRSRRRSHQQQQQRKQRLFAFVFTVNELKYL